MVCNGYSLMVNKGYFMVISYPMDFDTECLLIHGC